MEIAKEFRIRPRTKHINQKYWHFVSFLEKGLMSIEWLSSNEQLADVLTKALGANLFHKFVHQICGWEFNYQTEDTDTEAPQET